METARKPEPGTRSENRKKHQRFIWGALLIIYLTWLVAAVAEFAERPRPLSAMNLIPPLVLMAIATLSLMSRGTSLRRLITTFGVIQLIEISSPALQDRARKRYSSEISELTSLGFDLLFFFGEGFSILRIFLVFPALITIYMLHKRAVTTVQRGQLVTLNPVLSANDKSAFAHPSALGVTFHTAFQDGTLLITKTFENDTESGPAFIAQECKAPISEMWLRHQQRIRELEESGKRVDPQTSFQFYARISRKESEHEAGPLRIRVAEATAKP
jgi:hypothetical protein